MSSEDAQFASPVEAATSPSLYALANSGYFALQALPLLFTPGLLVILLSPHARDPTDIELQLSRFLGIALLLVAATPLQDPSTSALSSVHWIAVLGYHTGVFLLSYFWWLSDGPSVLILGMVVSGILFTWGTISWVFWSDQWRAKSSALFPPAEKRRMKVEKREKKWGKLQGKMG